MLAPEFFDGCAMVGWRAKRHPETIWRPDDFLAEYEYRGISAGLVHHACAVEYHQDYGNRRLLREIEGKPRLIAQWVLMPHHTGEIAPADELVPEMLELGVRAARIYPAMHGFPLTDNVCGSLLGVLAERRIPLFADADELSIEAAADLCVRYPELPVILCAVPWGQDRRLFPALTRAPNLRIETHAFFGHRACERFAERFGAERLIFGSGLPHLSPGATMMMPLYEDISDEDRAAIAGGNLRRLLDDVRTDRPSPAEGLSSCDAQDDDDAIVACLRAGEPLRDEFVFDAHGHIGHEGAMGAAEWCAPCSDADELVRTMDRLGVDRSFVSSFAGLMSGDPAANDVTLAAVARHPERLLGYACINPRYRQVMRQELDRVAGGGLRGYKPYPPRHAVQILDARHRPILEWCDRRGLAVLCHGWPAGPQYVTPDDLAVLAPMYPGAKFLSAHAGGCWEFAEALAPVARAHPNIYAEVAYPDTHYGIIEYLVRELGADRVVFGSDGLLIDPAPQLGWIGWARIPVEDKRKVLGLNMARLTGVVPRTTPSTQSRREDHKCEYA